MIRKYIHGQDDYALWGHVGRFLVNKSIQDHIGTCITSEPGDVWWVALTHKKETMGFSSARLLKNKTVHLRYFFSVSQTSLDLAEKTLINQAITYAKENNCASVHTSWRKESPLLESMGFIAKPREKGDFCRWELTLENTQ
jgi:hypothetical protein